MAKVDLKKGTIECDFHNDLFALHKNYGAVEEANEYWDGLCDAIENMSKKYSNTDMNIFVVSTLVAFSGYLNSKVKKPVLSEYEEIACIVKAGRTKEEIEAIIKALQKGVSV